MLMQQEIEKAAFMHLKDLKDLSIIEIKDPYYEDVLNELEKQ
jgi:hypothetical protein